MRGTAVAVRLSVCMFQQSGTAGLTLLFTAGKTTIEFIIYLFIRFWCICAQDNSKGCGRIGTKFSTSINFRPRTKRLDFGQSHSRKGTVDGHAPLPASVSGS